MADLDGSHQVMEIAEFPPKKSDWPLQKQGLL